MANEIITVETVGPIKPPIHSAPITPEEAAKGHNTVTMVFDKPVLLTVTHGSKIQFPAGVHEVPTHLANHWYLQAHGARPYAKPVPVSDVTDKPKGKQK